MKITLDKTMKKTSKIVTLPVSWAEWKPTSHWLFEKHFPVSNRNSVGLDVSVTLKAASMLVLGRGGLAIGKLGGTAKSFVPVLGMKDFFIPKKSRTNAQDFYKSANQKKTKRGTNTCN